MAGHSKWANIKHRKERQDKRRGGLFTKLAKAVTVAAREGGGDLEANFALRLAVDKARAANMPNDNIERAIARGTGDDKDAAQLERVTYEGYGPNSVAIIVEALTDNRNRTVGQVRSTFSKYGGNLGESGSVAWQFQKRGVIMVPAAGIDADDLALSAIDAGAIDVEVEDEVVTVHTEVVDFARVRQALDGAGYDVAEADLAMIPTTLLELETKEMVQLLKFVDKLEELDDVEQVWTNVEVTEDAVAEFESA